MHDKLIKGCKKVMQENKNTSVSGSLLVGANKSSRLAAMRAKAMGNVNSQAPIKKDQKQWTTGLKTEVRNVLEQSEKLIDEKVAVVLNAYPKGKKNTFFKLKYGIKLEKIKMMSRKEVFSLLGLETAKIKQFRLIENMDHNGNTVND